MSYEQAMKHSKNHRKDRYYQQCSGYAGNGECEDISEEAKRKCELDSFAKLIEIPEESFPIYIANSGGYYWHETTERNLFATRIENRAELEQFGKDMVGV